MEQEHEGDIAPRCQCGHQEHCHTALKVPRGDCEHCTCTQYRPK